MDSEIPNFTIFSGFLFFFLSKNLQKVYFIYLFTLISYIFSLFFYFLFFFFFFFLFSLFSRSLFSFFLVGYITPTQVLSIFLSKLTGFRHNLPLLPSRKCREIWFFSSLLFFSLQPDFQSYRKQYGILRYWRSSSELFNAVPTRRAAKARGLRIYRPSNQHSQRTCSAQVLSSNWTRPASNARWNPQTHPAQQGSN